LTLQYQAINPIVPLFTVYHDIEMGKITRYLLLLFVLCIPGISRGQTLFENWFPKRSVTFNSDIPSIQKTNHDKGAVAFFDYSWPLSKQVRLVGDMPFIHLKRTSSDTAGISSVWSYGNPFIGLEFKKPLHLFYWTIGTRIPLAPKALPDSSLIPNVSNINRWTALNYRMGSVMTLLNFHYENVSGFALRMLGGPEFGYSSRNRILQTYIKYAAQIRLKFHPLLIGGGISGLYKVTTPSRSIIEYYLESSFRTGSMEPGIVALFPLDHKTKRQIHYIIGLRIRFYFDSM